MLNTISIFCGSRKAKNPHFDEAARQMGQLLANEGRTLVYGGSNLGYMGTTSSAAMNGGGRVVGIIPSFFSAKIIHSQPVSDLVIVGSLAERKERMAEMSDGFVALAGGIGTLDEITDMLTYSGLGFGFKPVGILNTDGFYDPFLLQLKMMKDEGLLKGATYDTIFASASPTELLAMMDAYQPPKENR